MSRVLRSLAVLWLILATATPPPGVADEPKTLPGSKPLTTARPLVDVMVEGINRFCLRELAASPDRRRRKWPNTFPVAGESAKTIQRKIALLRNRLRQQTGIVDRRLTAAPDQHQHPFR